MVTESAAQIEEEVRATLEHDKRVNLHASQLHVSVQEDTLILEGEVEDVSAKRIAANLIRELAGGRYEVEDRLCVHVDEPTGDGELRDNVTRFLLNESLLRDCSIAIERGGSTEVLRDVSEQPPCRITVAVNEGVVTLTGQLPSLIHRRMVEVLTWWARGCQRVDNRLDVIPPERDSDEELVDAVRMALEKDPMVDPQQVHVTSHAGVIELEGQLGAEAQKLFAARDVWSVPGVWEVYNHIHVDSGQRSA